MIQERDLMNQDGGVSMNKKEALANFLEVSLEDIEEESCGSFTLGNEEYYVLTDEEADDKAEEYILNSIWAFNSWFLLAHMPSGIDEEIIKMAQEKCEGANETFTAMIIDLDHFVEDAISADGRGHFLSSYDGAENEEGEYFIYRVN